MCVCVCLSVCLSICLPVLVYYVCAFIQPFYDVQTTIFYKKRLISDYVGLQHL